ncbi:hypothetical protein S245_023715 [Arachis hypogaea]
MGSLREMKRRVNMISTFLRLERVYSHNLGHPCVSSFFWMYEYLSSCVDVQMSFFIWRSKFYPYVRYPFPNYIPIYGPSLELSSLFANSSGCHLPSVCFSISLISQNCLYFIQAVSSNEFISAFTYLRSVP